MKTPAIIPAWLDVALNSLMAYNVIIAFNKKKIKVIKKFIAEREMNSLVHSLVFNWLMMILLDYL
jgi:hypothetical protein